MNVSVVVTVLNEEKSILPLLKSIHHQTLLPNELVIVDGGSSDTTVPLVKLFSSKYPKLKIHLIEERGNISKGRNVGITKAKSEIIALIDAGCVANKDWLKKITEPFEDTRVGLVAGFYKMIGSTPLQKAVAPFHGITLRRLDPRSFLPSARSIAFRKKVWEEVGGFSEQLVRAGEDTLFNYAVIKKGVNIVHRPDAIVRWEVPKTFHETIRKFYWYAKGDAQTGIWWHPAKKLCTHNIKIMTIFARYLVFLSLFIMSFIYPFAFFMFILLLVAYLSWSVWKLHDDISDLSALLLVPVVQVASDFSVMSGFLSGIISS